MGSAVWQLSNEKMAIKVETDAANNIRTAAPIAKRFIGQQINRLFQWMQRMGPTKVTQIRSTGEKDGTKKRRNQGTQDNEKASQKATEKARGEALGEALPGSSR